MAQPLSEPYAYTHIVAFESDPAEEVSEPLPKDRRVCAVTKLLTNSNKTARNNSDDALICTRLPASNFASHLPSTQCSCILYRKTLTKLLSRPTFNPPPQITNPNPVYEIRQSERGGLGMFARETIEAGTLIIRERPLLIIPLAESDYINIPGSSLFSDEKKEQALLEVAFTNMDAKNRRSIRKLFYSQTVKEKFQLVDILRFNMFSCNKIDKQPHRKMSYAAIFDQISRINHSCIPNSTVPIFRIDSLVNEVYASKTIQKDDEIFGAYTSPLHDSVTKTRNRQKIIDDRYKFTCTCDLCMNPKSDEILNPLINELNKAKEYVRGKVYKSREVDVVQMKKQRKTCIEVMNKMKELGLEVFEQYYFMIIGCIEACTMLTRSADVTEEEKKNYNREVEVLRKEVTAYYMYTGVRERVEKSM